MRTPLYPSPDRIRKNYHNPVFAGLKSMLESMDLASIRDFLEHRVNLRDYSVDLREITENAERLTFLALGAERDDAADLALQAVAKLMEYSKWDYFMEGGRIPIGVMRAQNANLAVSLVLCYLGGRLPSETRREWIRGLAGKGIELCHESLRCMRFPDQVEGWSFDPESAYLERHPDHRAWNLRQFPRLFQANNLRAVTTNGLMTGTLTYLGEFGRSDDTDRWLEQARHSFSTLGHLYAPDGSYDEGVSYSGYTSIQMADLIRHFESLDGDDCLDCVNWRGNADFLLRMGAPTNDNPARIITFSDGPTAPPPAVSMWLADRFRDPGMQWYALNRTVPAEPRALLFFDPSLPAIAPAASPYLLRTPFDWIVAGGGHEPEDLVCAMRSGPPSNHEHADRNSLFLKCWGELLLPDPAPVPYSHLDPSWPLRLTGAHNAILIDGRGHQYVDGHDGTNASEAHASLLDVSEEGGRMQWTSDATQAYQLVMPDVDSVIRTVLVDSRFPLVVVADKVRKVSIPSAIEARFMASNEDGKAAIETGVRTFRIVRPSARLEAFAFSDDPFTISKENLPVAENKARAFPLVAVTTSASCNPRLVTLLLPVKAGQVAPVVEWRSDGHGSMSFAVRSGRDGLAFTVDLSGRLPVICPQAWEDGVEAAERGRTDRDNL